MALDTSVIGKPTGAHRATIERGPVSNFARALKDENPVYHDPPPPRPPGSPASRPLDVVVRDAVLGRFAEDQPEDPSGGENPMRKVMGSCSPRAAWCSTVRRSSSTTGRSWSVTC